MAPPPASATAPATPAAGAAIDPHLLEEAADWLVRLQTEGDGPALRQAIAQWRSRSPAHRAAWQRAERVMQHFAELPPQLGRQVLAETPRHGRRAALRQLALAALLAPAAVALWRQAPWEDGRWQTATGEQQRLELEDGTVLVLNTDSAVRVTYSQTERRIRLRHGEILVTTAPDLPGRNRPLLVESEQGQLRPLGTRFSVRQLEDRTRLAVFAGAVEITTRGGGRQVVPSGARSDFAADAIIPPAPLGPAEDAWEAGLLTANDLPLADFLAELGRYRSGVLRCHPAVAEMRVSGTFTLQDTEAALELLVKTRPLALRRLTRYWMSLEPRS
jgi:transmembrane sensor